MFTYKRLFTSVLIAVLLCSAFSIFVFEKLALSSNEPLMTYIYNKDQYDYSISIPTYWGKVEDTTHDIMFSGNNYEYFSLDFSEKESSYDKITYGTFYSLKLNETYGITEPKFETLENNNLFIYKTTFTLSENNYVSGYIDCGNYLVQFEYKRTDKNDINKGLNNIISSIQRFEVKEVSLDEQTTE